MKIDYNTCYYSKGDKHSICTHKNYCIFNNNRIKLEQELNQLKKELNKQLKLLDSIRHGYYTTADYDCLKKRIKLLNNDLNKLREFEESIKKAEVKKYGYQQ